MTKIKVVIVEWMGYPLFRKKKTYLNKIKCGYGNLINNMLKYDPGISYSAFSVINQLDTLPASPSGFRATRLGMYLNINNPETNTREKYQTFSKKADFIENIYFRDNRGQDIGAYEFARLKLIEQGHKGDVLFINSSAQGPYENNWLEKYTRLFHRSSDCGLTGISLNSHYHLTNEFKPHVQSFFLYTNMKVLNDVFSDGIYQTKDHTESLKSNLILKGEIAISEKVLKKGYSINCSMFPNFYYKNGDEWSIPLGDLRYNEKFNHLANRI